MDVAVVERFKLKPMYGLSVGQKKVAIVERWLLVDWFDCIIIPFIFSSKFWPSMTFQENVDKSSLKLLTGHLKF